MDDLDQIYDLAEENKLITETAREVKAYIERTWPKFDVDLEIPLRELFPDPQAKGGLQSIWKYGAADVVVRRGKKIVAIFEPGGAHHFNDPKQVKRDKCKWKLCELNGVRCFRFANSLPKALSNRKKRQMFGKFLFGCNNAVL